MEFHLFKRIFWGVLIAAAGVVFLLRQLGVFDFSIGDLFSTFWPVILIAAGINGLLGRRERGSGWWGIVPLGLGLYFLGRNLNFIQTSIGEIIPYAIPIGLILLGIRLIFKPGRTGGGFCDDKWRVYPSEPPIPPAPPLHPDPTKAGETPPPPTQETGKRVQEEHSSHFGWNPGHRGGGSREKVEWWNSDPGVQTRSSFIGDIHLGQDYWELKPLNISHFIGDTVLDLTKAQIPYGETKLTISSFIGDVKVFLPNDYEIGVQVISSAFIGDSAILDRRDGGLFRSSNVETPSYHECDKKIRLVVSTFIGDVRVTKVG